MSATEPYILREVMLLDRGGGFSGPVDIRVEDRRITRVDRDLPTRDEGLRKAGFKEE